MAKWHGFGRCKTRLSRDIGKLNSSKVQNIMTKHTISVARSVEQKGLINISLAIFNLIPVSPLDGSQIFSGYLMKNNPQLAWKIQSYGPQVLFGLILFGYLTGFSVIWFLMRPFVNFFMFLFAGV